MKSVAIHHKDTGRIRWVIRCRDGDVDKQQLPEDHIASDVSHIDYIHPNTHHIKIVGGVAQTAPFVETLEEARANKLRSLSHDWERSLNPKSIKPPILREEADAIHTQARERVMRASTIEAIRAVMWPGNMEKAT